jgi:hypothetical protein
MQNCQWGRERFPEDIGLPIEVEKMSYPGLRKWAKRYLSEEDVRGALISGSVALPP